MKVLAAVTSCWMHRKCQQWIRDTWLSGEKPSGFEVKFFLGRSPQSHELATDEVQVDVDDGYPGLPAKTQAMCRYALLNGYSHIFKCDVDTYVQLDRLATSDFAQLGDYIGRKRGPSGHWPAPYASGFSYWLSTKAMRTIASGQLTDDPAEDRWVGNTLLKAGIHCTGDYRYAVIQSERNTRSYNEGPRKGNIIISACEFETEHQMHQIHKQWLEAPSNNPQGRPAEDHPISKVCVLIKTFLRDGYLTRAVEGVKSQLPEARMVIVDDGLESRQKIAMYAQLRLKGHSCLWMPFDSGFGAKSNEGVRHCDREYVLIGSDDFAFGQAQVRNDVARMVRTLDEVKDLDIVSGRVNNRPYEACLREQDGEVYETAGYHGPAESCGAGTYLRCDLTVNYSLVRRSLLDKVKWDDEVKIGGGEHGMFFLDVQRAGGKVAYLPGITVAELPSLVPAWMHAEYPKYRNRAKEPGRPCARKRGIKRFHLMGGGIEES